ncbi:minichromosome maintenance protein 5 [Savitreella phatthalungensis]
MSGFDASTTYSASVFESAAGASSASATENLFRNFINEFQLGRSFIYREQLRANALIGQPRLEVDVAHLISFDEQLAHRLSTSPAELMPLFESAALRFARQLLDPLGTTVSTIRECQVSLKSAENLLSIRDLEAAHISRLVRISGIIIGASTLFAKATRLQIMCKSCRVVKSLDLAGGFAGLQLPRVCDSVPAAGETKDCPIDPYVVVHEKSHFIDQQKLKLQEAPDMVPVGELPRHIELSADRYLTNRASPGSRCTVVGIYSIYNNSKTAKSAGAIAIRNAYIRVLGLEVQSEGMTELGATISAKQEQLFLEMAKRPNFPDIFARSIAPSIFGNADIKKAIACLLVGGSKKLLPDGMRLRGDINVLLLGDPGTAKSQLLKFVEKASPIAVYTSGKGSSAAGLTASVQRDVATREFFLEGGAMVLADGGVVCIDEFDKMRDEDRVAIHEAMEQQTISIAKAGITTMLNSRTSVLAAANPIFGRYDDLKSPGDNIDFQTTVLSRFDMIFIVKDDHNDSRDRSIAEHVINIHMSRRTDDNSVEAEIPLEQMRRFIAYCKSHCAPRLSPEAAEKLSSHFVAIRRQVQQVEQESNERSSIPITIRQLEAIVRITESLAKLTMSSVATETHVDEAIRLFRASTMQAVGEGASTRQELIEEVGKIEEELRRRLPIGWTTSYATLIREFVNGRGFSPNGLAKALQMLEGRDSIQRRQQGQQIFRSGP